jgi:hypothetical protein
MIEINPKQAFIDSPQSKLWANVASSEMMRSAISAAMLQMHGSMGFPNGANEAAANDFRMQGARIFASILVNLATPIEDLPKRKDTGNLDHSV